MIGENNLSITFACFGPIDCKTKNSYSNIYTFQPPIVYDNSALQVEIIDNKGDLSVKNSNKFTLCSGLLF